MQSNFAGSKRVNLMCVLVALTVEEDPVIVEAEVEVDLFMKRSISTSSLLSVRL